MKRNLQKGILVTSACAAFLLGNVQQAYAVAADAIEIVQQNKKIAGIVVDQNGEAVNRCQCNTERNNQRNHHRH